MRRKMIDRPKGCLSPDEAAALIGVTAEAVKARIYKGKLRAAKARNGYWWIKKSDLKESINQSSKLEFKLHGKDAR